jgi:hypothetical protein
MTDNSSLDRRKNKSLIDNNKTMLKNYALKNYEFFGKGIIVINLLLLEIDRLDELNLIDNDHEDAQQPTIHQPISYIPQESFWFKTLNLKIKQKYKIDLQEEENIEDKFLIVFIKDDSIEHFSIYSISIK